MARGTEPDTHRPAQPPVGIWARGAEHARAVHREHGPERFLDLPYDALTGDPLGEARRLWSLLGEEFDDASHDRTLACTRRDRRENPGGHEYTLERYGLEPDQVHAAFGPDLTGAAEARCDRTAT